MSRASAARRRGPWPSAFGLLAPPPARPGRGTGSGPRASRPAAASATRAPPAAGPAVRACRRHRPATPAADRGVPAARPAAGQSAMPATAGIAHNTPAAATTGLPGRCGRCRGLPADPASHKAGSTARRPARRPPVRTAQGQHQASTASAALPISRAAVSAAGELLQVRQAGGIGGTGRMQWTSETPGSADDNGHAAAHAAGRDQGMAGNSGMRRDQRRADGTPWPHPVGDGAAERACGLPCRTRHMPQDRPDLRAAGAGARN
jgi:hypothetical protein